MCLLRQWKTHIVDLFGFALATGSTRSQGHQRVALGFHRVSYHVLQTLWVEQLKAA